MTAQDVQVAQACYNARFRDDALRRIVAIACAESNCDPDAPPTDTRNAVDLPGDGWEPEYSVGVFRINLMAHPEITEEEARNLDAAAMWAYHFFRQGNDSFHAWSTYDYVWNDATKTLDYIGDGEGAYVQYLDRADTAIAQIQRNGETLQLDEHNGQVDIVPVPNAPDGTQPLDLPSGILDIAAQCESVFSTATANLTTDHGTAEQRAALYNAERALHEFRRVMGAL